MKITTWLRMKKSKKGSRKPDEAYLRGATLQEAKLILDGASEIKALYLACIMTKFTRPEDRATLPAIFVGWIFDISKKNNHVFISMDAVLPGYKSDKDNTVFSCERLEIDLNQTNGIHIVGTMLYGRKQGKVCGAIVAGCIDVRKFISELGSNQYTVN